MYRGLIELILKHPFIVIFILIFILLCLIIRFFVIPSIRYKNIFLEKVFDDDDINMIDKCFDKKSDKIECYKKKQSIILNKINERLEHKIVKIGHARWSDGTNYDASSYHRDVKPFLFTPLNKHPNVYTLIIFLDDTEHIQGGEILKVKKGDCLLFNSFNLHKSKNLGLRDQNRKPRRILQYFHVFFNENEATEFKKHHSYADHLDVGNLTKYVNYFIDVKPELEYFNLVSYIVGRNYTHNAKYITYSSNNHLIGEADGVKYYTNF
mgnify:CR=1 FL=1|jgi:hypothetical protein